MKIKQRERTVRMTFNDENFMLKNEPAKRLYQKVKDQPIFDFHCHLSPKEI